MVAQIGGNAGADTGDVIGSRADMGMDMLDIALSRMSGETVAPPPPPPSRFTSPISTRETGAVIPGAGLKTNVDVMNNFNDALNRAGPAEPVAKLSINIGANNAQSNERSGAAKMAGAEKQMQSLQGLKDNVLRSGAGADGGASGQRSTLFGGPIKDIFIGGGLGLIFPGAGALYAGVSAARAMMPSGMRALEGLGTYSQAAQSAPSQFIKTASRGGSKASRAMESVYGGGETAAPSPSQPSPSQAVWSKLQNGPGFGKAVPGINDVAERSETASMQLNGITGIKLDKMIAGSNAMCQIRSHEKDAKMVQDIHAAREEIGLGPKVEQNNNIILAPQNHPLAAGPAIV